MTTETLIPDRGEFVDALQLLSQGHVLVHLGNILGGCVVDGRIVYHSYRTLLRFGLIREFDNPNGFPSAGYYRITERGREFAARAFAAWRSRPVWQRLAMRLLG